MSSDVFYDLKTFFANLGAWINNGSRETVDDGVKLLTADYKWKMESGRDAAGNKLAPLLDVTLEAPVKTKNSLRRKFFGDVPLNATGRISSTLFGRQIRSDVWEISSDDDQANAELVSNAKTGHSGQPFRGDTPKAIRDPLTVEEAQQDIMESQILIDLDKIVSSL